MKRISRKVSADRKALRFAAEAAYADSIFRSGLGDQKGSVVALERCVELDPSYAPGILSLGSVQYQRGRHAEGRHLFESLLALPSGTPELCEIIDEAGDFLIQLGAYADGLALYRGAVNRFPASAIFLQGLGCCAGHQGLHDEAVRASEQALAIEPGNQAFANDLGWALLQSGRLREAENMLERAVSMDASDELAQENLRFCREKISEARAKPATAS
jgi:tetratricopeptide (TPR) repeat protein